MVTVNTQGVSAGFEPVKEDGWYDAILTGYKEVDEAGEKGDPMGTMEFTIADPREDGHKCWRNFSLGVKSLPYIKGTMVELGTNPTILEGDWDTQVEVPALFGTKCKLLIKKKPYEGVMKDNVTQVKSRDYEVPLPGQKAKATGGGW